MKIMDIHTALVSQYLTPASAVLVIIQKKRLREIEKTEDNLPATNEKKSNRISYLFLQLESFF